MSGILILPIFEKYDLHRSYGPLCPNKVKIRLDQDLMIKLKMWYCSKNDRGTIKDSYYTTISRLTNNKPEGVLSCEVKPEEDKRYSVLGRGFIVGNTRFLRPFLCAISYDVSFIKSDDNFEFVYGNNRTIVINLLDIVVYQVGEHIVGTLRLDYNNELLVNTFHECGKERKSILQLINKCITIEDFELKFQKSLYKSMEQSIVRLESLYDLQASFQYNSK